MKILLVDHDQILVRKLARSLKCEGFEVEIKTDISAASQTIGADDCPYDLVISEWFFPRQVFTGLDFLKQIRANSSNLPFIMLTGNPNLLDSAKAFQNGADDFIRKPFHLPDLLARMYRALRDRKKDQELLEAGVIRFDIATQKVVIAGESAKLRPQESRLLRHLLMNRDRVVTRESIFSEIWKTKKSRIKSNVIDAHIKNLRGKLGEWRKLIRTVRGIGYRLATNHRAAALILLAHPNKKNS